MKKAMLILVVALIAALLVIPGQALADTAVAGAGAAAKVEQNFQATQPLNLLPGQVAPYMWPNSQYHNAPHTRTWNIFPIVELAKIRRVWTREQLEVIEDSTRGRSGKLSVVPYNAVPAETAKKDRSPYDTIGIVFSTVLPQGCRDKGIVQAIGDSKTNALRMAAGALLEAMNMGGNLMMITVEDADIRQYSETLSFMLGGNSQGIVGSKGNDAIGVASIGGIGWGEIESSKALAPHFTAYVLYKEGITLKPSSNTSDMDERIPEPTVNKANNGNGKKMEKYYKETQAQ